MPKNSIGYTVILPEKFQEIPAIFVLFTQA